MTNELQEACERLKDNYQRVKVALSNGNPEGLDDSLRKAYERIGSAENLAQLEEEIFYGGCEESESVLVLLPTDSEDRLYVGSACGGGFEPPYTFANEETASYLKDNDVPCVLGAADKDEQGGYSPNLISLQMIALPIAAAAASMEHDEELGDDVWDDEDNWPDKFDNLVEKAGGSFRIEWSQIDGWMIGESE